MNQRQQHFHGWPLVGWAALAVVGVVVASLATAGAGESGWRLVIRNTARTSVLLFVSSFVAPALAQFWPGRWSRRLFENRRPLFVAFAVSHVLHALAILRLAWLTNGASIAGRGTLVLLAGALVYVFIVGAAFSFVMGRTGWAEPGDKLSWINRLFSAAGIYGTWVIFMFSYGGRALSAPGYLPFALGLIAALALRVTAVLFSKATLREAAF